MKTSAMDPSANIEAFQILAKKFDDKEAKFLINWVEKKPAEMIEDSERGFATKEDLAKLEGRLSVQIADTQNKIILWTIGTMFIMFGLAVTIFKLLK